MLCAPAISQNILVTSARTEVEQWWTSVPTRATAACWHRVGTRVSPRVRSSCRLSREGVRRPVLRDLDRDVVQVACSVGVVGDERGDVLRHPPEDRQDDVLHHFRWREGVEAPVVHHRQA